MSFPKPLLKLIEEFQKFPSVGPRSAQRMAFHVLNRDLPHVEELSKAILDAKTQIKRCSICQNLSSDGSCEICSNKSRDIKTICVVSEPKDLIAIERTNAFKGTYHVLGGLISPIDGISPENLSIKELLNRAAKNNVSEIILALDTSVEGEATTLYLHRILSPICNKITRLGFGLPVGSELEYADELTLTRALETRSEIN
jgi:recombination protein RecR